MNNACVQEAWANNKSSASRGPYTWNLLLMTQVSSGGYDALYPTRVDSLLREKTESLARLYLRDSSGC